MKFIFIVLLIWRVQKLRLLQGSLSGVLSSEEGKEQLSMQKSFISESKVNKNTSIRKDSDMSFVLLSASQMHSKLSGTSLLSNRYGVSDKATATIASEVLRQLRIISDSDIAGVIDKSAIRIEKEKIRKAIKEK